MLYKLKDITSKGIGQNPIVEKDFDFFRIVWADCYEGSQDDFDESYYLFDSHRFNLIPLGPEEERSIREKIKARNSIKQDI